MKTLRALAFALSILLTSACSVAVAGTLMCERTDNSDQSTGGLKVTSFAQDFVPPLVDSHNDTSSDSGNTYATASKAPG